MPLTSKTAGLVQIGNQIAIALENAFAYREIESLKNKLSDEKLYLEEEINTAYGFEQLIGSSPGLKCILKHALSNASFQRAPPQVRHAGSVRTQGVPRL